MGVETGKVILIEGDGKVDGVYVTVNDAVLWFAAASRAVTEITFTPDASEIPLTVHELVPVATPLPPRSHDQLT